MRTKVGELSFSEKEELYRDLTKICSKYKITRVCLKKIVSYFVENRK